MLPITDIRHGRRIEGRCEWMADRIRGNESDYLSASSSCCPSLVEPRAAFLSPSSSGKTSDGNGSDDDVSRRSCNHSKRRNRSTNRQSSAAPFFAVWCSRPSRAVVPLLQPHKNNLLSNLIKIHETDSREQELVRERELGRKGGMAFREEEKETAIGHRARRDEEGEEKEQEMQIRSLGIRHLHPKSTARKGEPNLTTSRLHPSLQSNCCVMSQTFQ